MAVLKDIYNLPAMCVLQDGKYYLAEAGYHDASLDKLLRYYHTNLLPTVNVRLRIPYRRHPRFCDK